MTPTPRLPRGATRPFSLWVTLRRNPLRTLPMQFAILAAAFGVGTVVLFSNSIARSAVAPNDFLLDAVMIRPQAVAPPQTALTASAISERLALEVDLVHSAYAAHLLPVRARMLDLQIWFPIQMVAADRAEALFSRYRDRLVSGRLPTQPLEVVVPASFAKGRAVGLGDTIGGPGDFSPFPLRIVGLSEGPRWIGVGVLPHTSPPGLPTLTPDVALVFPSSERSRDQVIALVGSEMSGRAKVRPWTPNGNEEASFDYRGDMQLMLGFIVVINSAVLASIGGLLGVLYFRQRRSEFVLLAVLGRTRAALLRHVLLESLVVIAFGWTIGILGSFVFASYMNDLTLAARGIIMEFDLFEPVLYAIPLGVGTFVFSGLVTLVAFLRFDPVSELETRA